MKKLQLLTITMLFALAGTNTAEARIGSVRSSMMNRLIAQQENQDGTTAAEGTTDVKLPGGSSISKMMGGSGSSMQKMIEKARDTASEGTISSSQITNIKNGLQKKVKMIVEMIQNSSKQNQVILEMVQSLDDIPKTSYDIGGNPTSNTLPEGARTLA